VDVGGFTTLLIYILPAMIANGAPVVGSRFYGRGHPIDFGITLPDGRRMLGNGKTWEGLLTGIMAGTLFGFIESIILGRSVIAASLISSAGALLGDITGSFIKRRIGLERGEPMPLLDQLDFYLGALALLYLDGYRFEPLSVIVMMLIIMVLHISTNRIAYLLGLKSVPW